MFERFTAPAKRSITLAQDEAMTLGHEFIGTEHILLGLAGAEIGAAREVLREHGVDTRSARAETVRLLTEAGIPNTTGADKKEALASLGIDLDEIRRRAEEAFGPGRFRYPRPAFTPQAKKTLELSLREAVRLGHEHVGSEHLLLGLLAEGDGVGIQVLTALRVDPDELRPAVLARLES
jgi:ATP-dependent Clp protease ATP-binding subunit ClpC